MLAQGLACWALARWALVRWALVRWALVHRVLARRALVHRVLVRRVLARRALVRRALVRSALVHWALVRSAGPQERKGANGKRKREGQELTEGHGSSGHGIDHFSSGVQNKVRRGVSDFVKAFIENGQSAAEPFLKAYTEQVMKMQHDQDSGTFMNLTIELDETKADLQKAEEQTRKTNEELAETKADLREVVEHLRDVREEARKANENLASIQTCRVCWDSSHKRLLCGDSHYICGDCTKSAVEASLSSGGTVDVLKCCAENCEKCSTIDNLRDLIPVDLYIKYMMARENALAQSSNGNDNNFEPNCAYTPCCKKKFFDFDGCCTIFCEHCRTYFCAYCMGSEENGKSVADTQTAHAHVATCPARLRFRNRKVRFQEDDTLFARTVAQKMQIRDAIKEHTMALVTGGKSLPANMPFSWLSIYHTQDP